ncbi:uncharacterized protein EDB91DRAFT_1350422 [Suillus paluster]|uniref:uncharacterized protein n=1 Tax=Suillus paluster TaxID=48578 RepID=UPI001B85FA54|nr:uncharacterized protein EDB91DRAFT_1350422 [Suillus paluster]KAG1726974.1 hypothetical protein EDB91DRAFT_1350422 [Suillus paluster]
MMATGTDSASEATVSAPKGWTDKIVAEVKVKTMLATSIGKPVATIKDILEQVHGDQYVFSSGTDFYFWNCASDEGAVVTDPKGKDKLWKQMGTDITKVKVKQL